LLRDASVTMAVYSSFGRKTAHKATAPPLSAVGTCAAIAAARCG